MNALDPHGPHASHIANLFWLSTAVSVAVFLIFGALLAYALRRAVRKQRAGEENELQPKHGLRLVAWGGVIVPTAVLLVLLVVSAWTDRSIARLGRADSALSIQVDAHQFWWKVRYLSPQPHREFTSANEIHIPAGVPVRLVLESRDVIHSLWVPSLQGKMDLIPGRTNDLVIQASEPGVYRGQCAEFCGTQHAKMALLVVAHAPDEFAAWYDAQLQPHTAPVAAEEKEGHDVFMSNGCGVCHAIRGTDAHGSVAPDLTHFATRRTIAAGTLPNRRGHLAGWITDPQGIKPGSRMPPVPLEGAQLQALLTYLGSLH